MPADILLENYFPIDVVNFISDENYELLHHDNMVSVTVLEEQLKTNVSADSPTSKEIIHEETIVDAINFIADETYALLHHDNTVSVTVLNTKNRKSGHDRRKLKTKKKVYRAV